MAPIGEPSPELAETLRRNGQEHLLDGIDSLPAELRGRFLARLGEVDWRELADPAAVPRPEQLEQPRVVTLAELARDRGELVALGEETLRGGGVAVLMVAGGQGTRLGWDGPKGTFPLGPHSGKSIYQWQAEKVVSLSRRIGRQVPFLVLTSPATDEETRAFFAAHGDFGLAPGQLRLFR